MKSVTLRQHRSWSKTGHGFTKEGAITAAMRGAAAHVKHTKVSLPKVSGPTLEEIDAKYGGLSVEGQQAAPASRQET